MIFDVYTALRHMAADGKTICPTNNENIRYHYSEAYDRIGWIDHRADGCINEGSTGVDFWVKENKERMFELYQEPAVNISDNPPLQHLFNHMESQHGLVCTQDDLDQIIVAANFVCLNPGPPEERQRDYMAGDIYTDPEGKRHIITAQPDGKKVYEDPLDNPYSEETCRRDWNIELRKTAKAKGRTYSSDRELIMAEDPIRRKEMGV